MKKFEAPEVNVTKLNAENICFGGGGNGEIISDMEELD